jgi:hypothetical protein
MLAGKVSFRDQLVVSATEQNDVRLGCAPPETKRMNVMIFKPTLGAASVSVTADEAALALIALKHAPLQFVRYVPRVPPQC